MRSRLQSSFSPLGASVSSRESLLAALADVDAFLVRATYYESMVYAQLQDVSLDTAVPQRTGQAPARHLEACDCPPGYAGLSCQVCTVLSCDNDVSPLLRND